MSETYRQSYDDGLIQLDRAAITLRRYHFPSGTSKVIALDTIRGYKAERLGLLMHRFRIWGSSDFRRWLPLDTTFGSILPGLFHTVAERDGPPDLESIERKSRGLRSYAARQRPYLGKRVASVVRHK